MRAYNGSTPWISTHTRHVRHVSEYDVNRDATYLHRPVTIIVTGHKEIPRCEHLVPRGNLVRV